MLANSVPWESDGSEEKDDVLLLLSFCHNNNKRKRKWVHDVNLKRKEFGEVNHLMKHLREDEDKFKRYFRMNSTQFDNILSLIKADIEKKNLNYKESISEEQRLALCLR
ncbi:hypothetical protein ILUMI_22548 [Ignelater luminosus]|uniref:Uncharacterized protein n=1 Tax=Ignelater luminosus TaxID=2038154 RepID=A0A8K0CAF1_IGNLU|nr:hypothetical protein ILUMI_22548 [Ignelater luminosus]